MVRRPTGLRLALVVATGLGLALLVRCTERRADPVRRAPAPMVSQAGVDAGPRPEATIPALARVTPTEPPGTPLSAAEKAERVDKIKRDYDEIRSKAAAEYSAAGNDYPGGLNAFVRQLALLEREKRADLAAVLSPRELEDLELRETLAGKQVQRLLGSTVATDEQKRAVFRLQRDFDDRFALTFDLTPKNLLDRESTRQALQEQIRGVLDDALFAEWLKGEGPDYGHFVTFAAEQGLPADTPLNLWRAKNEFIRRRLELSTQALAGPQLRAAQLALAKDTEIRVLGIVGPAAMVAARREILGWLPK